MEYYDTLKKHRVAPYVLILEMSRIYLQLVWFSGLSAGLQNKVHMTGMPAKSRSLVPGDADERQPQLVFFSLSFSLPSPV